ncbi:MAG: ATP-binding protein [Lachnospiraceae bacterium]|nr:ATP-binding protein [Lachnospiraceae bacterium]
MQIWIGVENFAKIESAKICINNYTVLVGPNNSGKTFLMQLMQGMSKKLVYMMDETIMSILLANKCEAYKEYVICSENIAELVSHINSKLSCEKEKIIKEIFGKNIVIEKLYIDISMEESDVYSLLMIDVAGKNAIENIKRFTEGFEPVAVEIFSKVQMGMVTIVTKKSTDSQEITPMAILGAFEKDEMGALKSALHSVVDIESLFLPASRTGLMLLYREFFAKKTDKELAFVVKENRLVEDKEHLANLTQPVYEFLRFLQTYSEREDMRKKFEKELIFFEEQLIEGHISVDEQGVFSYSSENENNNVPMYLASSMINEVAPLILAITSQNVYNRLIIDEVEASLHPQKQLELVRFLNRLSNKGMQIIVSTHSDTFVSKLNNLYILSEMVKTNEVDILEQFNLEKEDLISTEKLFVYEFVNQSNGKSVVREIKANEKMGYQFDLFTASAMHLYEEANKLGEIK